MASKVESSKRPHVFFSYKIYTIRLLYDYYFSVRYDPMN